MCMPSVKNIFSSNAQRIILTSFVVPILYHLLTSLTWEWETPLSIKVLNDMPSFVIFTINILPLLLILAAIAVVSYLIIRRKIAMAATISTALSISAFLQFRMLNVTWAEVLVDLTIVLSPAIFYGFYALLVRAKRPVIDSIVLIVSTLIVSIASTLLNLHLFRLFYMPV